MKKSVSLLVGLAVVSTPVMAQVRPDDCRPVFPLTDPVQTSLPQDVIAERAVPAAVTKRSFFGLPLIPFLLGGGGLCLVLCGSDGGNGDPIPVSPA